MTEEKSLISIIKTIYNWRKPIIIFVLLSILVCALIVFNKPDYYRSETSFYAANASLANPSSLGYTEDNTYIYGTSEDLDRIFSIVSSEEMIDHLIKKFDLHQHYHIDSTTNNGKHKMRLAFKYNYNVSKSKYEAVVLSVEDIDPKLAANIANYARERTDELAQNMTKKAQLKLLSTYEDISRKQESIAIKLSDSIKHLKKKFELIEPSYQAKALAEGYVDAAASLAESRAKVEFYKKYENKKDSLIKYQANTAGYNSKVEYLDKNLSDFNKGVNELKHIEQEFGRASDQLSIIKEKYKLLKSSYDSKFSAIHTIDEAKVADYKSRPKRLIILVAVAAISTILATVASLLIESFKKEV
jgi:capsule polysaccharide export protein KpsE/RkpR